jgi:hypothetical protein
MNQGNSEPRFMDENGVFQDGALFIHTPSVQRWIAFFFAFQSQVWHTDDVTGRPILDPDDTGPAPHPGPGEPDHIVRIVAALVNPIGPAPERETVTLLNTSPTAIDLAGWTLVNKAMRQTTLSGTLQPGEARAFVVDPLAPLGNNGGTIALINAANLKVDGAAYTREQAKREGWTITF